MAIAKTAELSAKNTLPHPSALAKSPTEQRRLLEELIIDRLTELRADIVAADDLVKNAASGKEAAVAYATSNTMASSVGLDAAVKVGTLKHLAGFARAESTADSADGVFKYEFTEHTVDDVIESIMQRGLTVFVKRKITPSARVWYAFDPKVTDVAKIEAKVKEMHEKAYDQKVAGLPELLREAKFQFEAFKKHYPERLKQIFDIESLNKSPLL